MGCISSKEKNTTSPKERLSRKGSLDRRVAHVNSLRRDEGVRSKHNSDGLDVKAVLIDKKTTASNRFAEDQIEEKLKKNQKAEIFEAAVVKERSNLPVFSHPGSGRLPKSFKAEQIAAGWPSWLASVAGEAISGWVPRRANNFEKLDRIGQGTYSNVYKARDITHDKIVALKKVRFDNNDTESVKFMAREIVILRRLDHPNVIKLEGLITSPTSCSLYLVFEYMEHDLTGVASLPGLKFTDSQIKCYMRQLLNGLAYCHDHGVLHRDIKGSNLLIDDNGILKIADFGLASFFDPQSSGQLTSRVVTLWYRAPELLLGVTSYGVAVDLWSTGCILGELYAGKPILPGRTEVEQLHKIFKLCGSPSEDYWRKSKVHHSSVIKPQRPYKRCVSEIFKDLPAPAVGLIEVLLSMDPAERGTAAIALKSEFFTTKPFACDPSSLPKYPPSKEIDAKLRDEEARRKGAQRGLGIGSKESMNVLAPNTNSNLIVSQRARHSSSNNRGAMFNSSKEQKFSGLLIDPSRQSQAVDGRIDCSENQHKKISHSGPLVHGKVSHSGPLHGPNWTKTGKDLDHSLVLPGKTNLSIMSGLVASRTSLTEYFQEKPAASQAEVDRKVGRFPRPINRSEPTIKQDQNSQTQKMADYPFAGGKSSVREQSPYARGSRENKIYMSGPLLPSNNMEQMLKDHDRHIQEFARRRLDKAKPGKTNSQGKQAIENLALVSGR